MIPVLGIPFYNRADLLQRCIASIDHPVDTLVIVHNGPESEEREFLRPNDFVRNLIHIRHPNAGVAGAWNEIIKLFPAPWWMLVNNDIQFTPGDLEKMAEAAQDFRLAALFANHGHSFFIITNFGVRKVGLFDENIYPAYLEDCDWMWRAQQVGVAMLNVQEIKAIHGDGRLTGSCTIQSDPKASENNHRTHGGNFGYYRAKWGGVNGEEQFTTPFNDPSWPVWAWKFEPSFRAQQQWTT